MLPFPSIVSDQILFLIQSLNDSNFDSVFKELCQFASYGSHGSILLLQTLFDQINFNGGELQNMPCQSALATAIVRYLLDKPNFSTVFCQSLPKMLLTEGFLWDLSTTLHLSIPEKISVGLALTDSEVLDFRIKGQNFCISQIEELCSNGSSILPDELVQNIITFLSRSEGLNKHVDSFINMLSLLQQKENYSPILAPLFIDEISNAPSARNLELFYESTENDFNALLAEIEREMSMEDVMKELGYGCTSDLSHCKELLSLFLPLNEGTIARILGMVVHTHVGLEDNQNIYTTFCSALCNDSNNEPSWLNTWNVDVLVVSIKQLAPETNWIHVIENLDHEGFYIPDTDAFSFFMSIYSKMCQDPFPLHAICGSMWKNAEGQLSFLKYAISAPSEIFTFAHSTNKLMHNDSSQAIKTQHELGNQAWYSLDLLGVLCQLAESGHASAIRAMLDAPLKHSPDILLLGFSHINTTFNLLQHEVASVAFPLIVENSSKLGVAYQLWHINPNLVLWGFLDVHSTNPDSIVRILEICQELKILQIVLDMAPLSFTVKLAAVAFRKDLSDLEKWLTENLSSYKDAFFEVCIRFLKETSLYSAMDVPMTPFQDSALANVYQDTSSIFLKTLQSYSGKLVSPQLLEEMQKFQMMSMKVNTRSQTDGASSTPPTDGYPEEVEAEANTYFHQMFSGQLTIDTMMQVLSRFKESSEKREQLLFECIIGNLFEEYKFFPKYPEKELKVAAVLFGSLIKHQLVTHLTLGIALRGVLDALRRAIDSKMFMFGVKALEQFVDRLVEWPQYCNHILQISHLRATHADLVAFIERALARISSSQSETSVINNSDPQQGSSLMNLENVEPSQKLSSLSLQQRNLAYTEKTSTTSASHVKSLNYNVPETTNLKATVPQVLQSSMPVQHPTTGASSMSSTTNFLRPRGITSSGNLRPTSYSTGFGSALNIETLVSAAERRDTPIEAPSSEIQDKILFMINNISSTNMEAKTKEFTEILKEEYYPWFAQYMVMKRASIEPNFHDLYLKFLEKVDSKSLNKEIVKATYENCKVLLKSELIKSSSEERSLLKNLGSWLGKFTIGRNQALRAREIDPKMLIIEAYEKGLMIAVIPFTSKVLEPCQSSLAYQPPNPWTMGILGLLAEIYALPNLKMNLKFDIEVLFKNLGVDMKEVKPTSLLKDRVREVEGNPDFSNKDIAVTQPVVVADGSSNMIPSSGQVEPLPEFSNAPRPGSHGNVLTQYAPLHLATNSLGEDDKTAMLGLSERQLSGQGLTQVTPSQTSFSLSQLPTQIPNIGTHIVINQKLNSIGLQLPSVCGRIVPLAMERAIREIINPVTQRSVTIASQTTKELVLKDYAMESDESRIYNAAHLMVASLAGSLSHVTSKEPLRVSISNHIRSLLQAFNVIGDVLEHAVQILTHDNLDLGCAVMEQTATEKALQVIDGEIATTLASRRKKKEGSNSTYFEPGTYSQGTYALIPEALRPKPGRLSAAQQRVYEDFVKYPWHNQSSQGPSGLSAGTPGASNISISSSLPRGYGSNSGPTNTSIYSQVAPGFNTVAQQMDLMPSEEMDPTSALMSSAATHTGPIDSVLQHGVDTNSSVSTISVTTQDLHPVEASNTLKDPVTVPLPSPTPSTSERPTGGVLEPLLTTGDVLEKYQLVAQKLETLISNDARDAEIQIVIAEVPEILLRCVSRDEAALAVAQKVFKSLYENSSNHLHVHSHLAVLAAIRDVCKLVVKELTSWVIYSDEDRKFDKDITIGLIRSELLSLAEYNVHLAKLIDGGRNKAATEFAISLVQTLVVQEPGVSGSELYNLIDALAKLAMRPGSPESLQQLVDIARNPTANTGTLSGVSSTKEDKSKLARDKKVSASRSTVNREDYNVNESIGPDPSGFRDQVSHLFKEWFRISELPVSNEAACTHYVSQLQQSGLLKGDDMTDRFFRVLTELSVAHCIASEVATTGSLHVLTLQPASSLSFIAIDMYAKLVIFIIKYCAVVDQGPSKISLLPKILSVTVRVIQKDAEDKKSSFNPRPYFRLFLNWILDLTCPDPVLDNVNFQILTSFANAFHALQPLKVPGWSFAWLELISHRGFMPKLLLSNSQKGWPFVQRLLVDLFKFMEPYLRNAELGEPVQLLYKGTLRVLLVLLHDFPEFLCDYHFSFCDVIPPSCIQMRNVILSAFPRNMRLPDPSTPNLKIDLLAEISQSPRILSEVDAVLKAKQIKSEVDEYFKSRQQGSSFLTDLKLRLLLPPNEAVMAGTKYNVPLINSLVMYVGILAIQQLQSKSGSQHVSAPLEIGLAGAAVDIFQTLISDLDTEGRYLCLNAIANQLRYPNNHAHYFSFVLLFLFAEANQEIIQEQITRVLLERLIVNRPHPWGLLITFIELIKNPRYNFWNRSFTRCATEIEKLFESVSRSCGGAKSVDDSMVSTCLPDNTH